MGNDMAKVVPGPGHLMTQEEAAHTLHLCTRTLQRLRAKGELTGIKGPNGRVYYHPNEVREWAKQRWAS